MFDKLKVAVSRVEDAVKSGDQGRMEEEKENLLKEAKVLHHKVAILQNLR